MIDGTISNLLCLALKQTSNKYYAHLLTQALIYYRKELFNLKSYILPIKQFKPVSIREVAACTWTMLNLYKEGAYRVGYESHQEPATRFINNVRGSDCSYLPTIQIYKTEQIGNSRLTTDQIKECFYFDQNVRRLHRIPKILHRGTPDFEKADTARFRSTGGHYTCDAICATYYRFVAPGKRASAEASSQNSYLYIGEDLMGRFE